MLRKILIFGFLLGLYNTGAQAAITETVYTGIQVMQATFDYDDGIDEIEGKPSALAFRIGGYLDQGAAIEFRLGTGLKGYGDTTNYLGADVDFEVEAFLGLYSLYHIGWGSNASFYGLLGLTNGEVTLSALGLTTDDRETNVSYGIGLNIAGFNFEFTKYFHNKDYDVTAISFGYVSKF